MNKAEALYKFWSSFGWKAIDEESAYDEEAMEALQIPDYYISYESSVSEIGEPVALTASLWDRGTSWMRVEEKAEQIYEYIGPGGCKVNYSGGQIWITRRQPFSKRGATPDFDQRRIILNINAEFLSA